MDFARWLATADRVARSDIAFLGGIARRVLETGSHFRGFAVRYTNAASIVDEHLQDAEDLDGLFSPKYEVRPRRLRLSPRARLSTVDGSG